MLILNLTYYLKRSCYVAASVFFIKTILRLNSPAPDQSSLPGQLRFVTPRNKNSFRNIIAPLLFPLGLRRNRHYRKLWTGPSLSQLLPGKIVCYFCCQFRQQIFSLQVLHSMHGLFHATTISIQKAGSCQVFAQQSLAMKITLLLQLAATTTAQQCLSFYLLFTFLATRGIKQGLPKPYHTLPHLYYTASYIKPTVSCNLSASREYRFLVLSFSTAITRAFLLPTRITRFLALVTPV